MLVTSTTKGRNMTVMYQKSKIYNIVCSRCGKIKSTRGVPDDVELNRQNMININYSANYTPKDFDQFVRCYLSDQTDDQFLGFMSHCRNCCGGLADTAFQFMVPASISRSISDLIERDIQVRAFCDGAEAEEDSSLYLAIRYSENIRQKLLDIWEQDMKELEYKDIDTENMYLTYLYRYNFNLSKYHYSMNIYDQSRFNKKHELRFMDTDGNLSIRESVDFVKDEGNRKLEEIIIRNNRLEDTYEDTTYDVAIARLNNIIHRLILAIDSEE